MAESADAPGGGSLALTMASHQLLMGGGFGDRMSQCTNAVY
jgi:hypothetical protein